MVQKVFNDSHSVVTSCKVKRSRVAALQVPAVYVLGCAKLLQYRKTLGDFVTPKSGIIHAIH